MSRVARLLRDVLDEAWGEDLASFTLVQDDGAAAGRVSLGARVRFGLEVARHQAGGHCPWMLFAHPSLARVQGFVPGVWRRPYAVFLHGIEVWNDLPAAQERSLRGAALRIANSSYTASRVMARHPQLGVVEACPLALPRRSPPPAADVRIDVGARTALLVARMAAGEQYKGHDQLIEAWPLVQAQVPDARLVLVGDGSDAPRLRAKASAMAPGAITFTGFVPEAELAHWFRGAAVFAMPSRGEGFGLAYLEAMTHGVPCIGAVHDAARDVIEDGVTGFLVDQSNRDQLAARVVQLLTDAPLRRTMGEAGRRRAEREFSYERFAARLQQLLSRAFGDAASTALAGAHPAR